MSEVKISELPELSEYSSEDLLAVVDASEVETKKIKAFNLKKIPILDASYLNIENNSVFVDGPAMAFTSDGIAVILKNGGIASGANHDWERILTSTSGDFVAQIQLEEAGSVTLETGTMALSDGNIVVGDGQSPANTLVPVGAQKRRVNLLTDNNYSVTQFVTGFANTSGAILSGGANLSANTGVGFSDFINNPTFRFPILGSVSGRTLQLELPGIEGYNYEIWLGVDTESSSEIFTVNSNMFSPLAFESFTAFEETQDLKANFSKDGQNKNNFFDRPFPVESVDQFLYTGEGGSNIFRAESICTKATQNLSNDNKATDSIKHSIKISEFSLNSSSDFRSTGDFLLWFVGEPAYKIDEDSTLLSIAGYTDEQKATFSTGLYLPSGSHNGHTLYTNTYTEGGSGVILHKGSNVFALRSLTGAGTGVPQGGSFPQFAETNLATVNGVSENSLVSYLEDSTLIFGLSARTVKPPSFIDVSYFNGN